jgi:hypothetical protein
MEMRPATQIQIGRAGPEEAVAIAGLLHESFVEFKALYTEAGFAATIPNADQVAARIVEGPVWVAVRQAELLGTAAAVIKGASVYIRGMGVIPAARGIGNRPATAAADRSLGHQSKDHRFVSEHDPVPPFCYSSV